MKIESVTSLRNICEVKLAVLIANHENVRKIIFFSDYSECLKSYKDWDDALSSIVDKIMKKISPDLVNVVSKFLVTYVAINIKKWATIHHLFFDIPFLFYYDFFKVSYFTSRGRINEDKAARALIRNTSISLFMRYKIACYHYMDDIIPVLWQVARQKQNFKRKLKEQDEADPVVMWSEYLEEKEKVNPASLLIYATESFVAESFLISLDKENLAGVRYCWRAMTPSKRIVLTGPYFKALHSGEKYVSVQDCGWLAKLYFYRKISYYDQLLNSDDYTFEKVIDILEFFLRELKKEECADFLYTSNVFHELFFYLLRWPYQHLFLPVADYIFKFIQNDEREIIIFEFSGKEFYSILHNIVDVSRDPFFCRTYNYSYLFKEFWGRSPSNLKDLVIDVEREVVDRPDVKPYGTPEYILEKLILHSNFTSLDEYMFRSIVEHASSQDKVNIFRTKGSIILPQLVQSGKFRLANMFLDILNLEDENVIAFKESVIPIAFRKVFESEDIALAEEFVKFVVTPPATDDFKKEILSKVFEFPNILDFILESQISLTFLKRIYKWFFLTDEKLEDWKSNVIFDRDFAEHFVTKQRGCSLIFDIFFQFLGYSRGKIQDVKREILLKAMPFIILKLVEQYANNKDYGQSLENRVLYLCLYNKERVNEFTNFIDSWCQDYVGMKMCLFCRNSNHVYEKKFMFRKSNQVCNKESKLYCKLHDIKIMLPEDINKICSSLTDKLKVRMDARKLADKSIKATHYENHICQGLCNLEVIDHCGNCKK